MFVPMFELSVAWLMCLALADEVSATKDGVSPLHSQVAALFEARCATCHDRGRGGEKGDFGHILDLPRLLNEADVVVRGEPDRSLLWMLCADGEMPPKPPTLTGAELNLIRAWILDPGADMPTFVAPYTQPPAVTLPRFLDWIGRFHPTVVHFPIALLVAAALAECLQLVRKQQKQHPASHYCLVLGSLTGAGAALLGWAYADPVPQDQWLDALHRWLGTFAAMICLIIWLCFLRGPRAGRSQSLWRYRAALMLLALLVGVVGFLGGALHYGLDHYMW